jgi:hypothetical protein
MPGGLVISSRDYTNGGGKMFIRWLFGSRNRKAVFEFQVSIAVGRVGKNGGVSGQTQGPSTAIAMTLPRKGFSGEITLFPGVVRSFADGMV